MENVLIARIGKNLIGFDIKKIHFVIRNKGIVQLPDMPKWIDGIISYRDKVIAIINNKEKLKLENDNSPNKRIVLVKPKENVILGINIDEYINIKSFKINNGKSQSNGIMSGTVKDENKVVSIIDVNRILSGDEVDFLKKL